MPANTKPSGSVAGGRSLAGPTSGVPLGAKKTVGGARKAIGGVAGGAVKTAGGSIGGATRGISNVVGASSKPVGSATKSLRSTPNPARLAAGSTMQGSTKPSSSSASTPAYPTAKKTAVKPNSSKPFVSPDARPDARKPTSAPLDTKKPYPGTSTLPGQGGKTPVKRSYKPAPTLGSQVKPGQKMVHIGAF